MHSIALLAEGAAFSVADVTSLLSEVTSKFTPANVVTTLGVVVGGCGGLYLFWWGGRKCLRMIKSALNGRLKL